MSRTPARRCSPQLLPSGSALATALLVVMFVGVGLMVPVTTGATPALPPAASHPARGSAPVPGYSASPVAPAAFGAPVPPAPVGGSVRGTFFSTTTVPNAPSSSQASYYNVKVNVSNEPSINLTSKGVLAVAYTAYTTKAPCAAMTASARSEVGFVSSADGGKTWMSPRYLGNPDCTAAGRNFSSAWEPTLTSLANGTLVLAYVEFNVTSSAFSYLPETYFGPSNSSYGYNVPYDRLVVTESYNGGGAWTPPTVLNTSVNKGPNYLRGWAPLRPWAVASGSTVYVAWENATRSPGYDTSSYPPKGIGSMQVHVVASTDGGATWGPVHDLPVWRGNGPSVAMNPTLAIGAGGALLVAYTTNVSFRYPWIFPGGYTVYYVFTADVVVASSTNNGSSFAVHAAATDVALWAQWASFDSPSPQVAYSGLRHQVVVAFSAQTYVESCAAYCSAIQVYQTYVANSSTLGATWSPYHPALPKLDVGGLRSYYLTNPSIAIDDAGVVHLEVTFVNTSVCQTGTYGQVCGPQTELAATSTDNGATFGSPLLFSDTATPWGGFGSRNPDGEYATVVAAGKTAIYAWVQNLCPTWKTGCSWPSSNPGVTTIEVSVPYKGGGSSLTFVEKGLPAGTHWAASVMGNPVAAVAPNSLTLTGIPPTQSVLWNITRTDDGYGYQFTGKVSAKSPVTLAKNLTVYANYTELVLLDLETAPTLVNWTSTYSYCSTQQGYHWDYPSCSEVNYNVTPKPGAHWVKPGTSFSFKVTPAPLYCSGTTCYDTNELNLTFNSISGAGTGSVSTTGMSVSGVAHHPINETASFTLNGWCYVVYGAAANTTYCFPAQGAVTFAETGLPRGIAWAASAWSQGGGNLTTNRSTTPFVSVAGNGTSGLINFAAWTVPAGGGRFWVPRTDPASPVELPGQSLVQVSYTLESPANQSFGLEIGESGLPNGTAWSLTLDRTMYGERTTQGSFQAAGGEHSLNASPVYLPDGTGFAPASVVVVPLVENASATTVGRLPFASLALNGTTFVTVEYAPVYWVAVDASRGGSVSASSLWVGSGAAQSLTAYASTGFRFSGWSGSGPGSVTSSAPTITVKPLGPLHESATFVPLPPATFNVSVNPIGLPAGVGFAIGLGGRAFGGVGQFTITGVANGTYALALPFAYLNATDRTRFVPTLGSTTFSRTASGALVITTDGSLVLNFAAQYLLMVGATGNGTVSPGPGSYWTNAGASVAFTATPQYHYRLAAWNGSGNGSVNARTLQVTLHAHGPIWETAQFVWATKLPTLAFALTVREGGLPNGASWNVSVGSTGASAHSSSLVVGGLNGTYVVEVPPVVVAPGVRYVAPSSSALTAQVTSNTTVWVNFTEEFALSVIPSWGGTTSVNGTAWEAPGSVVTLSAVPAAGARFVGWSGNGDGGVNSSEVSVSVTVSGPVSETASFAPVYPAAKTANAWAGAPLGIGLLAGLAAVGVGVGVAIGRRRPSPPGPAPAWTDEGSAGPSTDDGVEYPFDELAEEPGAAAVDSDVDSEPAN